jgi:5-methyltetrahydropteroyltriglutamate--homocysteine methyltransferase
MPERHGSDNFMQLNTDRIQTTHVGSLVRPPELVAYMRKRLEREAIDDAAYEKYLGGAVGEVVRRQVETGLSIVNDGEYSKSSWYRYVTERLNGLEYRAVPSERPRPTPSSGLDYERFRDFYAEYHSGQQANTGGGYWAVTGPISYRGQAQIGRDIANLKAALRGAGASGIKGFLPVAAPASVLAGLRDEYYGSEEKLSDALGAALATEYKAITDAGLIVQIDDAWLAAKYDVMVPPGTMADYRAWAEQKIAALNRALDGVPESQSRYHVCWGSWNGPHSNDVAAADIIDLILEVKVGGYSLEMANPRHEHEWRLWEKVELPPQRVLVPGVISHTTNVVEHPMLVAERLVRLAKLVGRERVIGSTDCGFAQGVFYQRVHPSIMWAKLGALAAGARLATAELWGKAAAA